MAQYLCPFSGRQFLDANGDPYNGAQLFTYEAGSTTKVTTTMDSAGSSNHANPIILNSRGEPADGAGASQAIWQTGGTPIKLVLAPAGDTDPPVSPISTWDNISGINDTTTTIDQWINGPTPTYVSGTQFTLVGDQTSTFHIGRRLKLTDSGGTDYGVITASAYTTLTTVTVALDSGSLDSGLSAVSYGLLSETNHAIPFGAEFTAIGDMLYANAANRATRLAIGNQGQVLVAGSGANPVPTWWVPRDHIEGLIPTSNATDPNNDIDIAVGECADSGNAYVIKVASAVTRQLDAAYGTGNGGLSSSLTAAANTTYYIHAIINSSNTHDVAFDTSATAANLTTDHSIVAYRQIGVFRTNPSNANINTSSIRRTATQLVASDGGAGWYLLESQTANDSATIDFTNYIDSTFENYVFVLSNVLPASSSQLIMRLTENYTTWISGTSYYSALSGGNSGGTAINYGASAAGNLVLSPSDDNVSNSSTAGLSGLVHMYNPADSGEFTRFTVQITYRGATTTLNSVSGGCLYGSASTVVGVRFLFSSGNISRGNFRLYGIKN